MRTNRDSWSNLNETAQFINEQQKAFLAGYRQGLNEQMGGQDLGGPNLSTSGNAAMPAPPEGWDSPTVRNDFYEDMKAAGIVVNTSNYQELFRAWWAQNGGRY
ncbi:MAG: hypothetical protein H8D80_00520 [Proteobacteria bacterium]|nr:hypothetical protein [Pseudomonadota bacterium]